MITKKQYRAFCNMMKDKHFCIEVRDGRKFYRDKGEFKLRFSDVKADSIVYVLVDFREDIDYDNVVMVFKISDDGRKARHLGMKWEWEINAEWRLEK